MRMFTQRRWNICCCVSVNREYKRSKFRLIVVYRPPYSDTHPVTISMFLDNFDDYLESIILCPEPLPIAGDFNIHVDIHDHDDSVKFMDLLVSMGLVQHVNNPTHQRGHILDLIITREVDSLVHKPPISDCFLSDHCTVLCNLSLLKPSSVNSKRDFISEIKSHPPWSIQRWPRAFWSMSEYSTKSWWPCCMLQLKFD